MDLEEVRAEAAENSEVSHMGGGRPWGAMQALSHCCPWIPGYTSHQCPHRDLEVTGIAGKFFVGGNHEEPDLPLQSSGQLLLCEMHKGETREIFYQLLG